MSRSTARLPVLLTVFAVLAGAFLRFHELGRVPPGLHYDFAANAILADDIAFGNFRQVFITSFTGKEVLFFYTAALLFQAAGSSIFILQLTAAFYGVLGLAACWFAARQLTWGWPHSRWLAAFATAILAFVFMHVVWSRYGERATAEPFVQGLAVGFLFRGLRLMRGSSGGVQLNAPTETARGVSTSPLVNMILAGAFTGLAAYTYLAARLFPIPMAVALVGALAGALVGAPAGAVRGRAWLIGYGGFGLAALGVFAPLGLFFLQHPETFLVRAGQLTPRAGEGNLLWRGITGALGMIFIYGEPYDRFNIPGRPIFGPVLGLFFVVGLALVIARLLPARRARRPGDATRAPKPGDATYGDATHRPGDATYGDATHRPGDATYGDATHRPGDATCRVSTIFLLTYTLTFLAPTALSVHDIFPSNVRSMGLLPLLTLFPAAGLVAGLDWLAARFKFGFDRAAPWACALTLAGGCAATYNAYFNIWATAPALHYANDADLAAAAQWLNAQDTSGASVYFSAIHYRHPTAAYLARDFASIRWFTGGQSLAIPPGPALYVFPHSAPPPDDWVAGWTPIYAPPGPDGTPDFRAYRFSSAPPLPDFRPVSADFGDQAALTGYRTPEPGVVDFRMRVLNPPDQPDYRLVADLVDAEGYHWTQAFNDTYFSEQWQAGETILMRLKFAPPVGTPPGDYDLLLTLYSASAKQNVAAILADGRSAAYAKVGPVPIPRSDPQPLAQPLVTLGGLNVVQLDPPPAHARPGERLPFTVHWQAPAALAALAAGQTLVTRLGDRVLESGAPVHGTYPVMQWQPGELVIDRHAPRLPRDLPPGAYNVTLNDFLIGTVTVDAIDRQMAAPSPAVARRDNFGGLFEFVGYDLQPGSITLYWHTLKQTDTDYTTFVHVLGADGGIVAQHDAQPREGGYPTSLWAAGEYVSDTIPIPTAGGTIEIGWYVPETGERLGEAIRLP